MSGPIMPCTEIKTPDHGKIYVDREGRAFTVDQRRLPQYDAPPAAQEPDAATVALALAEAHKLAVREWAHVRRHAVEEAARACGAKVEIAFLALIRPENQL